MGIVMSDAHFTRLDSHCRRALESLSVEEAALELLAWVHADNAPEADDHGIVPRAYINHFFYGKLFTAVTQFQPDQFEVIRIDLLAHGTSELEIGARIAWMMGDSELIEAIVERANQFEAAVDSQEAGQNN